MNAIPHAWAADAICLRPDSLELANIAAEIYHRTCRTDFDSPGFCVLNVGRAVDSVAFRQLKVRLKGEMAAIHQSLTGSTLVYLSAARFDQQTTTKPHLDGGPDECFLMLGYEPTEVSSELEISDYAKCAFDLGLSPKEFMQRYNPMFRSGYELLRPYSTRIPCFNNADHLIVCINNSSAPFSRTNPAWQGTLHTATIIAPDESKRRVINSTMIASAPLGTMEVVNDAEQEDFISTSVVRRKGYDKQHLDDDA